MWLNYFTNLTGKPSHSPSGDVDCFFRKIVCWVDSAPRRSSFSRLGALQGGELVSNCCVYFNRHPIVLID
jgi:hypothetical protein